MKLLDLVGLICDLPEAHLEKGHVGTIVEELGNDTVLVEFADLDGVAYAIAPVAMAWLIELKHGRATATESPRLSRRLQTLRGWSHEQQIDEVRTRGA